MRFRFIKEEIHYTGEQLHSLYTYDTFGVAGDSIVAFIAEHFDIDLEKAILRQYLLIMIIKELLNEKMSNLKVTRIGTDLIENDAKLAVSTATASPVSSLVYVGVNIVNQADSPVKTKGLADYKIDPTTFASEVMDRYSKEIDKVAQARCRIRWVE